MCQRFGMREEITLTPNMLPFLVSVIFLSVSSLFKQSLCLYFQISIRKTARDLPICKYTRLWRCISVPLYGLSIRFIEIEYSNLSRATPSVKE